MHVIPAAGGEPVQATDAKLGVGEFTFAPDERLLAFTARTPEEGRYGTLDGVGASAEDARRITTLQFQSNGLGWTNDRRRQLFVTEVPDPYGEPFVEPKGRAAKALADAKLAAAASDLDTPVDVPGAVRPATQLTRGDFDHSDPTFTPDGTLLAASSRHDERDLDLLTEVFAFDLTPDADRARSPGAERLRGVRCRGRRHHVPHRRRPGRHQPRLRRTPRRRLRPGRVGQPRRLTDAQTVQVEHGLTPFGRDGVLTIVNERGRRVR